MKKEQLRERLKRLNAYVKEREFKSIFLEEGTQAELDTVLLGLEIGDEMSIDISCNYVHVSEFGNVLQFYGQLALDPLLEENPEAFTPASILEMINRLNRSLPVGQFLYFTGEEQQEAQHIIGIRYTMLTELDQEAEMEKCVSIICMLMNIYEILCSSLFLLLEGESLEGAMDIVASFLE